MELRCRGVVLVRPQDRYASMHHSTGTEPPTEDTLVSGYLEVTMKERRRCQAMSVGVQSVCKLNMGGDRGWEIDGIFERGVEILGGDSEGIWLEKGVQTYVHLFASLKVVSNSHYYYQQL